MSNYANVKQVELCPQCGSTNIEIILDDIVCGDCGSIIGSIFDVPEDEANNSVPVPTTSLPGHNFLPDLPAPFSLTTSTRLHRSMMGSCPSEESAPEGLPFAAGDPGSAEQCFISDISSSSARCFPEAQKKQWPSHSVILDAIIRARDLRCPFYVKGSRNHPCTLHPLVWMFCDGLLVSSGVLCENRKED